MILSKSVIGLFAVMAILTASMYTFIYSLVVSMKYASVAVLMFFFPSETVMPIVGYAASFGRIELAGAVIAGVIGTTLWSLMIYAVARLVGPRGIKAFVGNYGKPLGIRMSSVQRAGKWFDRYAGAAVFVGRFVPGARTAICIPAGLRRMPPGKFFVYSLLGSCIDVAVLTYLGYTAHTYFHELRMILNNVSNAIVIGLVTLVIGWWLWDRSRHRSE